MQIWKKKKRSVDIRRKSENQKTLNRQWKKKKKNSVSLAMSRNIKIVKKFFWPETIWRDATFFLFFFFLRETRQRPHERIAQMSETRILKMKWEYEMRSGKRTNTSRLGRWGMREGISLKKNKIKGGHTSKKEVRLSQRKENNVTNKP